MNEPTLVSLCSGAGGLDRGLENVGYRVVAVAENDRDASRVLAERFAGVPNLGDLTRIRWEDVERPDGVAAGFPCQPLSLAGKGLVEADPRWLWPEVARALRVLRPGFVLLENVPGIFRRPPGGGPRPIGVVLADLAALGYDAVWARLRASDLGAPHGRDRWFCAAVLAADPGGVRVAADGGVRRGGEGEPRGSAQAAVPAGPEVARAEDALADRGDAAADAERERLDRRGERDPRREAGGEDGRAVAPGPAEAPTDAGHGRKPDGPRPAGRAEGEREAERTGSRPDGGVPAADALRGGLAGEERPERGLAGEPPRERRGPATDADVEGREGAEPERAGGRRGPAERGGEATADADGAGREGVGEPEPGGVEGPRRGLADGRGEVRELGDAEEAPADAGRRRRGGRTDVEGERAPGRGGPRGDGQAAPDAADGSGLGERAREESLGGGEAAADADGERRESGRGRRAAGRDRARAGAEEPDGSGLLGTAEPGPVAVEWGVYEHAVRRWESALGRFAPRPTDDRGRLDPRFPEWMLGFPEGWVDLVDVSRTAQLRLLGNAVQVQCAEVAGLWLAEIAGMR